MRLGSLACRTVPDALTAADARHWAAPTRAALAARRTEIDALNVFPVPDGDTGTNLYLTFDAAIDAVVSPDEAAGIPGAGHPRAGVPHLSRGPCCSSARGNSGVIRQPAGAGLRRHRHRARRRGDRRRRSSPTRSPPRAAEARASVAHPVEGTILTVADAAATAAREAAEAGGLADLCEVAARGRRGGTGRAPRQLPALAAAGVVDAGGAGYVLMLDALHRVVSARRPRRSAGRRPRRPVTMRRPAQRSPHRRRTPVPRGVPQPATAFRGTTRSAGATAHPTVRHTRSCTSLPSTPEAAARLTTALDALGDSLLVVGGPDIWSVHVHVDDVGAAVEAGIGAGRPERIRVTHFGDQVASRHRGSPTRGRRLRGRAGIADVLRDAGAVVVDSGPGRRASTGQLLEAARHRAHAGRCCCPATGTP